MRNSGTSSGRTGNVRNVRFAPDRSEVISRQSRILRSNEAIIEVPEDMYTRGRMMDLE